MNEVTKMEAPRHEVAEHQAADPMLGLIERVIMSPEIPVDRITALMDIRERQMAKAAEQEFNAAFAAAMAEMPDVPKSGRNKHTGRTYPTLDDLVRTARPVLSRHGLSLNWQIGIEGEKILVRAIVRHSGGHFIETSDSARPDKSGSMNAIQGGGSTQTYLKRYTGFAILGLSSGDENEDDGDSAGPKQGKAPQQDSTPTPRQEADRLLLSIHRAKDDRAALDDLWKSSKATFDKLPDDLFAEVKAKFSEAAPKEAEAAKTYDDEIPY